MKTRNPKFILLNHTQQLRKLTLLIDCFWFGNRSGGATDIIFSLFNTSVGNWDGMVPTWAFYQTCSGHGYHTITPQTHFIKSE